MLKAAAQAGFTEFKQYPEGFVDVEHKVLVHHKRSIEQTQLLKNLQARAEAISEAQADTEGLLVSTSRPYQWSRHTRPDTTEITPQPVQRDIAKCKADRHAKLFIQCSC